MLKNFITRPILAAVISIIIVLLGSISLLKLPMTLYPDIAPPCVLVQASYPGANAETVARSVAPIVEEAINGVDNMTHMTSTIGNDGTLLIFTYFKLGTDPDMAAVNVQNRVSTITSKLPETVVKMGITTIKQQNSQIMIAGLVSDNPEYDEAFLQNYASINIIPEIKRVTGVGKIETFGMKDYSMRVWLKPDKMSQYNINPDEVAAAIQDQNIEGAPGYFGENSKEAFEYTIVYSGKFITEEEFRNIVIRSENDGSLVYLRDVAEVELGQFSYISSSYINGKPGTFFGVYQMAGTNANEIQVEINKLLEKKAKQLPASVELVNIYNTKESLDISINQVKSTLLEAFVLVFILVYLFLQNIRSTLIIAIAIPVSIIGTFLFMQIAGFSINLLTLFALVLSVGIVVDDAVVVVEAVNHKMTHKKEEPLSATFSAMGEITSAVISSTLVMVAVFAPVGFIEGSVGIFYRQFAITMMSTIALSGVCALTLCPALCALLLREKQGGQKKGWNKFEERFSIAFNAQFDHLVKVYGNIIYKTIKHKWISLSALGIICLITAIMLNRTPKGFIPNEDDSFLMILVDLPVSTSLHRTEAVLSKVDSIVHTNNFIRSTGSISGFDMMNNTMNPSAGALFVSLKLIPDRGAIKNIDKICGLIQQQISQITDASFFIVRQPTIPGFSNLGGVEFIMQDRAAGSLKEFNDVAGQFVGKLYEQPEIAYAINPFKTNYPQYELIIDHKKAKQLGVNISNIMNVMQTYYGSYQCSDFNMYGKNYKVILQANPENRKNITTLSDIYVPNTKGESIPISAVASFKEKDGVLVVSRFNMFNSIMVNAGAKPGYSSGDLIDVLTRVAAEVLPHDVTYEWQGMAREETQSGSSTAMIFILSIVLVYLILCGLYESFLLPLAVLLSIPTALLGVFLAINAVGIDNNIYVQVSMLMLIGLMSKNAILIVEYALQRRLDGKSLTTSAIEAAKLRLRPILMTSLTFVVGLIPMLFSVGPSAVGNVSISISAIGGMLSGIVLGVLIVPVLFVVFRFIHEKISSRKKTATVTAR
ncbi:MAG: efflux RND transporter permease subunit [Bacteroidales bacterium]|nr:efflux RND transporter permease subunit [Bacteroidales bacterium]